VLPITASPGIVGECGGALACATCHGYVAEDWVSRLPPSSDLEKEMLESCIDVRPNSRLACQLTLERELDGLTIYVPKSQT
jgi:2Fe-2S ferredoxin